MRRVTVRHGALTTLCAFALLAAFAVTLGFIVQRVDAAMLENKWDQLAITADVICDHIDDAVRADSDWGTYDYSGDYGPSIERLDAWAGVFAALYDENGELLTNRRFMEGETPIYPWGDYGFIEAVSAHDYGEVHIPSVLFTGKPGDMRLYYRWIPTGNYEHKLLLVVGMDSDALYENPTDLLVYWCVTLLIIAGLTVAISLLTLTHHRHDVIPKEEL